MRCAAYMALGLVLTAVAGAQAPVSKKTLTDEQFRQILDDYEYWRAQEWRYLKIRKRALSLMPERRDQPLRELNITDNEVREVETIAQQYLPRSMMNISPVVSDCACEEGPTCTAQVYVVASTARDSRGLQLSRMNDSWGVGVVQQWWLRYDALERGNTGSSFLDQYLYDKARYELYEEFPVCVGKLIPARKTASIPKTAEKK